MSIIDAFDDKSKPLVDLSAFSISSQKNIKLFFGKNNNGMYKMLVIISCLCYIIYEGDKSCT